MGSDLCAPHPSGLRNNFNPPSPCGEGRPAAARPEEEPEISIHPPRVGSDPEGPQGPCICCRFQSTLPVWGATSLIKVGKMPKSISIHAPRVGSDPVYGLPDGQGGLFQSTLPVWGATPPLLLPHSPTIISIHAPRVGSDTTFATAESPIRYFNPRSPCGERQGQRKNDREHRLFQSTLPVWGATGPKAKNPPW